MNLPGRVMAHRGYFNKESRNAYRENSKELCRVASNKDYVEAIELDVRKSQDGILYCYHGTLLQFFLLLKIPRDFAYIRRRYHADRLSEVLEAIPGDMVISLDLQDASITRADILDVVGGKRFKEVILAAPSVSFLDRFHDMPGQFVKFMVRNPFAPSYDPKKLKDRGYKYYEVMFPFQATGKVAERAARAGLGFSLQAMFFLSEQNYWRKVRDFGVVWIASDVIDAA